MAALVIGIAAGLQFANTTVFTGPLFAAIGYDIAPFIGIVVGGGLYLAAWRGPSSPPRGGLRLASDAAMRAQSH